MILSRPPIRREVVIGDCRLLLGDCREILPTLGKVDAVVTDPPYGLDWTGHDLTTKTWQGLQNDDGSLDLRFVLEMPCPVLSFGGNCYPHQLPCGGRWLCWDKRNPSGVADACLGSPFELAWSNRPSGYDKMVRINHGAYINDDGQGKRVHPTQKPIRLMVEAIRWIAPKAQTILDPFMGSGTTGVACVNLGRRFIGIEIDEGYFEIACERIRAAVAQGDLFREEPKPVHEQQDLLTEPTP